MKENFDSGCPLFWSLPDLSLLLIGFSSAQLSAEQSVYTEYRPLITI